MSAGDFWLSLKVTDPVILKGGVLKPGTFISIPKGAVPSAVRRNRLKRLIREAVRGNSFFDEGKVYCLRVRQWPGRLKLDDVKRAIERLK